MVMRSTLLVALLAVTSSGLEDPPKKGEDLARKDLEAMQGMWQLSWGERNGRKFDFPGGREFTIRGNKYCFGDQELMLLKLDPSCNPRLLDMIIVDKDDGARGQTVEGIYKIDGDTMVWCWYLGDGVKQRPLEFKTAPNSGRVIYGYARVKR